ncbi:unnamed protein product [Ceutorhynchus assimilis]|uniref:Uncharacterized protein n=1 Tax=Ceutorhynchus assimilis TaxID=467358 RepID=A0A9N9MRK3_9CUCU|nr:unnamed protein product [Ceutorhynchus assimilis]
MVTHEVNKQSCRCVSSLSSNTLYQVQHEASCWTLIVTSPPQHPVIRHIELVTCTLDGKGITKTGKSTGAIPRHQVVNQKSFSSQKSISSREGFTRKDNGTISHSISPIDEDAAGIACNDEENDHNVLKKLVKLTITNNALLREQNQLIKDLNKKLAITNKSTPENEELLERFKHLFPIKDDDALKEVNSVLGDDKEFYNYVVSY